LKERAEKSGRVSENIKVKEKIFLLRIETDEKITAKAGQFLMIKISSPGSTDPLLKRPFAVFDLEGKVLSILYKITGRGTYLMSLLKRGDRIELSGPFGNSFPLPERKAIFVSGGSGIASLNFLGKNIQKKTEIKLYYGIKNSQECVPISFLSFKPSEYLITTEDGSLGKKGLVTDFIKIENGTYYLAGPAKMSREFHRKFKVDAFASLEERMACGIGVCMGCGILTEHGYKRVCADGPVFNLSQIRWED